VDPEEEVPLLAIGDYRERIMSRIQQLPARPVALSDALGCVVAADVNSPLDLPPFTSSAMDGYAVRAQDISDASDDHPVALRVAGEVLMGRPPTVAVHEGEAVTVSTGAMVPPGADVVVPVELTVREEKNVLVLRALPGGKHVRLAGEDVRRGDTIVVAGRRLHAPDIGALAAAGVDELGVVPRARVGIVSTGDELVRPGRRGSGGLSPKAGLGEGQIFEANSVMLAAAVQELGAEPVDAGPVGDDPGALIDALDRIAPDVDMFVCSGGVSMGENDPVKRAFLDSGDITFANVAMQPGRPQAFGLWRAKPFFGLPGNPISAFVSFEAFVRPALAKMTGRADARLIIDATLEGELEAPSTRTRFARVRVHRDGNRFVATPEGGHQSNLLVTFARADGLVEIPAGKSIKSGKRCRVILIRDVG
jgi:molybdenum cofactor synthesis domain-containing protein